MLWKYLHMKYNHGVQFKYTIMYGDQLTESISIDELVQKGGYYHIILIVFTFRWIIKNIQQFPVIVWPSHLSDFKLYYLLTQIRTKSPMFQC